MAVESETTARCGSIKLEREPTPWSCKSCEKPWEDFAHDRSCTTTLCGGWSDEMRYLATDLGKDKVKFLAKVRCDSCTFRLCIVNDTPTCLWCLNDYPILKHTVSYGKHAGKTHAFVIVHDFPYCMWQLNRVTDLARTGLLHSMDASANSARIFRAGPSAQTKLTTHAPTKLTHLTRKILREVPIEKKWM